MNNKVLVLENDFTLDGKFYVNHFLEHYEGEQIIFTGLHSKTNEEIFNAVSECTDIVVQTCFVNGSDNQFWEFFTLLSNIKESKNIYIALLGNSLVEWFNEIDVKSLIKVNHHNIYEMLDFDNTHSKILLDYKITPYLNEIKKQNDYKYSAKDRLTGERIKILNCNANGAEFLNLPQEADVLNMKEYDPNPGRGVWIWGQTEPIKLVNDCGLKEYEFIINKEEPITISVLNSINLSKKNISLDIFEYLEELLNTPNDEDLNNLGKANIICEELNIPKRGNRQAIYNFLNNK